MKTNVMRMLDAAKIKYEVIEYSIPIEDFTGEKVSKLIGMDPKACYKTLGLIHDHDVFICVIATDDEIDLKKCAKQLNVKNLEMIHVKDLLKLVGYERGSVSPIGVKKNKGIFFDDEVLNHPEIEISGGNFGVGIKIKREDIINYLNAKVVDIVQWNMM